MVTKGKSNKPVKKRVYKRKVPVKKDNPKQTQTQTSKAIGNIVNIYEKPKRQYTRKQPQQPPKGSGGGMTSIVTQIHNLPILQTPMPNILGSNNLRSAELTGNLGIVRQNEINNGSGMTVGGNKDNFIPSPADILKAEMETDLQTPKKPKSTTLKELNKINDVAPEGYEYQYFPKKGGDLNILTKSGDVDKRRAEKRLVKIQSSVQPTPIKQIELTGFNSSSSKKGFKF